MNKEQLTLIKTLEKLKSGYWGIYHLGKYYVTINTQRVKDDDEKTSELDLLTSLQQENFVAMIHEYMHYIHEVSTYSGLMGLHFDIMRKALLTKYLDSSSASSMSHGIKTAIDKYQYLHTLSLEQVLHGSTLVEYDNCKVFNVVNIDFDHTESYRLLEKDDNKFVHVPLIEVNILDVQIKQIKLHFGRFFVLEGIAYEIDRLVDKAIYERIEIIDTAPNSEYTVLRSVVNYIAPGMTTYDMLTLASLSLSYNEVGKRFVEMLRRFLFLSKRDKGDALDIIKNETSLYLDKIKTDLFSELNDTVKIFIGRKQLSKAFKYLISEAKKLHLARIENPSFEIDLIFQGRFQQLYKDIAPSDQLFTFISDDEYMRDILTTSLDSDISQAHKVLIGFSHYASAHLIHSTSTIENKDDYKCPFYSICNLPSRTKYDQLCSTKPWRLYEIHASSDHRHCWYGQGVLELKGINDISRR